MEKEKKVYLIVIIVVSLFIALLLFLIAKGWLEISTLLWFIGLLVLSSFFGLIIYIIQKRVRKNNKTTEVRKLKGSITLKQFRDLVYCLIYLERGFNYKTHYDIIVGYLGKETRIDTKDKEKKEEVLSRVPIFETTLEHKYTNEKIFILINRVNPNDIVIMSSPSIDKIKEVKENFAFGKEKSNKKIVKISDPLSGKVQEVITDEPEIYTKEE